VLSRDQLVRVNLVLGHRSVSTTLEYVELDLKITGQALENELSLYMDDAMAEVKD
jgi:hypothetical protein